jgi:DNA-binding MarR family transcriptional regulator
MRKEFAILFQENMISMGRFIGRMIRGGHLGARDVDVKLGGYSRRYLRVLVLLKINDRVMLKDLAQVADMSRTNLCPALKVLEKDGLVRRETDRNDRRNAWYSLTGTGMRMANRALDELGSVVERVFEGLSAADEKRLTDATRTLNDILKKIKNQG